MSAHWKVTKNIANKITFGSTTVDYYLITKGVIPHDRDTVISITFTAKEFCTAIMVIQLVVSQFNAKPIVCRFCASSKPGLDK
jgi:hypothetical protein